MKVRVDVSQWAYGDVDPPLVLKGGEHELENPSAELVAAIAAAHDAGGAITILDTDKAVAKLVAAHVEPDKASLAFQVKCDAVRAELQPDRDDQLDRATDALAQKLAEISDDADEAHVERLTHEAIAAHERVVSAIVEDHDALVDLEIRRQLGGVV